MMKFIKLIFMCSVFFSFFVQPCFSQQASSTVVDSLFLTSASNSLESAIYNSIERHAVYSYNLSNATTPGFTPILFPDDEVDLFTMLPEGSEYFSKVIVEHMTAKMALNRVRHAAYFALLKKQFDNYRQVATLGKK